MVKKKEKAKRSRRRSEMFSTSLRLVTVEEWMDDNNQNCQQLS